MKCNSFHHNDVFFFLASVKRGHPVYASISFYVDVMQATPLPYTVPEDYTSCNTVI